MSDRSSRLRHLTRRDAAATSTVATVVTVMAIMMFVGMGFQPGWANGWPMGISRHVVFATFVTMIFAIVSISGASALIIWLGFFAEQFSKRSFVGWITFFVAMMLVAASVLFACPYVFAAMHAEIVREWR